MPYSGMDGSHPCDATGRDAISRESETVVAASEESEKSWGGRDIVQGLVDQ